MFQEHFISLKILEIKSDHDCFYGISCSRELDSRIMYGYKCCISTMTFGNTKSVKIEGLA